MRLFATQSEYADRVAAAVSTLSSSISFLFLFLFSQVFSFTWLLESINND